MTPARQEIELQIERWAAWAPGLASQEAWLRWLADPVPVPEPGEEVPSLAEVPAMMRRRIEPLGRVALQAAYWAQGSELTGPVVFASRWGEVGRSVGMLQALAATQALSPTAFSLSVHNAIGALYSIARKDRHNYQAVSAAEFSAEAGFIEAAGLLADGAERVLLVYFDAPLPDIYAQFESNPALCFPHAFACLLTSAQTSGIRLSCGAARQPSRDVLAPGLEVLRFLIGDQARLHRGSWTWARDAG
jgi:Beta-ketoacyl synthase, N-terminal domain